MTTIILTSGSTWTVPADFNSFDNRIEVLGGGGNGAAGSGGGVLGGPGGNGGGGGAYTFLKNVSLLAGSTVNIQIGTGGAASSLSRTWFINSSTLLAQGGNNRAGGGITNSVPSANAHK